MILVCNLKTVHHFCDFLYKWAHNPIYTESDQYFSVCVCVCVFKKLVLTNIVSNIFLYAKKQIIFFFSITIFFV